MNTYVKCGSLILKGLIWLGVGLVQLENHSTHLHPNTVTKTCFPTIDLSLLMVTFYVSSEAGSQPMFSEADSVLKN